MPFHDPLKRHLHASILSASTDPVAGLDHSLPIHPDESSSKSMEYWEDQLHKKQHRKPVPKPLPKNSPPDDHQIDDYA